MRASIRSRLVSTAAATLVAFQVGFVSTGHVAAAQTAPSPSAPRSREMPKTVAATSQPSGDEPNLPPTPPGKTELIDRRTPYSRTFSGPGGQLTTEFFMQPVFYLPPGQTVMQPVDLTFLPSAVPGMAAVSDHAPTSVSVGDGSSSAFITLASGPNKITLSRPTGVPATTVGKPSLSGPVADFSSFYPGIDLRVLANGRGAKSFFIWRSMPSSPTISYVVDAPGLVLNRQPDGSIAINDSKGVAVATVPQPYAVDSTDDPRAGGGHSTNLVALALGKDGKTVSVTVDQKWLSTATFPVYVDPSTGWLPVPATSGFGDAHTASATAYRTHNYADYQRPDSPFYHEMWNGTDPGGISGDSYDFLRWNVSVINGATIDAASMRLFPYHQYFNAPTTETTFVRKVASSWSESTITWANQPANPTNPVSQGCVEGTFCTWDVKAIVQAWATTPSSNFGFQVDTIGKPNTYWKRFISSEQGGTNVPALSITYHTVAAPSTPDLAAASDTGASSTDNITKTTTNLVFTGTSDPSAVVTLYDGATSIGSATANTSGAWSITAAGALAAGSHAITAKAATGGPQGPASGTLTLVVDTSMPGVPSAPDLAAASDLGSSSTDNLTSATTNLVFTGTAEANASVTLLSDGVSAGTGTADGTGAWSVTAAGPFTSAGHTVTATATDIAGNGPTSASVGLAITVDSVRPTVSSFTAPATPTAATSLPYSLTFSKSVTGLAAADFTISGTATGWTVGSVTGSGSGPYTITLTGGTAGTVILTLAANAVTDTAGNTGPASATAAPTVTVDRTAPAAPIVSDDGPLGTYRVGQTIYFRPSAMGTVVLEATGADAESSIASSAFGPPVPSAGWVYAGQVVPGNPASFQVGWTPDAQDATFAVTTTNGAGLTSPATVLSFVRDDVVLAPTDITPSANASRAVGTATVSWVEPADTGSGLAGRSVQRQRGSLLAPGTCSGATWTDDAGVDVTGSPLTATGLANGSCYRWKVTLTDRVGNTAAGWTAAVLIDETAPTATFTTPSGVSVTGGSTSFVVAWTESDASSNVATRALQREVATPTGGSCPSSGWSNDGTAVTDPSPVRESGLALNRCYRWQLSLNDHAGNASTTPSGTVRIGSVALSSTGPGDSVFAVEPLTAVTSVSGVDRVEFLVDGSVVGASSNVPYSFDWSTVALADGPRALAVRVVPTSGAAETSASVDVVVNNALSSVDRIAADFATGRISQDQRAVQAVYAFGGPNGLDPRYRSDTTDSSDTTTLAALVGNWANLGSAAQTEIQDFYAQPLRGEAYNPPPGDVVGVANGAFPDECHYSNAFLSAHYCIHDDAPFAITYWLPNFDHPGVPDTDVLDRDLNPAPNGDGVPDFVERLAAGLQDAKTQYETMQYRHLPDHVGVTVQHPPCGYGGCTTFIPIPPGIGNLGYLEMSIDPTYPENQLLYLTRHELFHAVQYMYAYSPAPIGDVPLYDPSTFWTEATAEWGAREADRLSAVKDPQHLYARNLVSFLGRPELPLTDYELPGTPQRQYGAFIFAAYLQQRFGALFLERIWESRAAGESFMGALEYVATNPAYGYQSSSANILTDFAKSAYLMSLGSDPDLTSVWLPLLDAGASGGSTPHDAAGQARPHVIRPALVPSVDVVDTQTLAPGGFLVEEFAPATTPGTRLHVQVSVADDFTGQPDVNVQIARFDHVPNQVCDVYPVTLGLGDDGQGTMSGEFSLTPGAPFCSHVALIFTNTDRALAGYFGPSRTIRVTARLDPPSALVDDFDRTVSNGWGAGAIGQWTTLSPTYDQYLSVNGSSAVANQVAPAANGDITLGVSHPLSNPFTNPIDVVYTFHQTVASSPPSPFIDDVFYVASDLSLRNRYAGVEIYNSPSSQSGTWAVAPGDAAPGDNYVSGYFIPSPWGGAIKLRLRVDGYGTFVKLWMATAQEPQNWTAYESRNAPLDLGWQPSWLVLQPRQTNDTADAQQFTLDQVQIVSGLGAP